MGPQHTQPLLLALGEDNPSWSATSYDSYTTDPCVILFAGVSSYCQRYRQAVSVGTTRCTTWKGSITLLAVGTMSIRYTGPVPSTTGVSPTSTRNKQGRCTRACRVCPHVLFNTEHTGTVALLEGCGTPGRGRCRWWFE